MKEIFIISGQRKTTVFSIFAAAALVLTVSACTLTGIEPDGTEPLSGSELTYFKGLTHNFHCASAPFQPSVIQFPGNFCPRQLYYAWNQSSTKG